MHERNQTPDNAQDAYGKRQTANPGNRQAECIFVCLEENVSGERFLQNLKEKIPELPERNTPRA